MEEKVVWSGKPTVWAFLDGILGGLLLVAVSITLLTFRFAFAHWVSMLGFACAALMVLFALARVAANTYTISNRAVRRVYRLVTVRIDEAPLRSITNTVVTQGVVGRILNFGDVRCDTAGTIFPGVLFKGVKSPVEVKKVIDKVLEQAKAETLVDSKSNSPPDPQWFI